MSAVEVLSAAQAAGITVILDGENLLLEATSEPPRTLVDALANHKPAILALLRPREREWSVDDWRTYFSRRSRKTTHLDTQARASAFESCVAEWCNQHPAPSSPAQCAWCGMKESSTAIVLPFGINPGTLTWLHGQCWAAWHQERRAGAIAALDAMGIRA
jgi:hypothetical protein